jgi:hypothetical protein
LIVPPSAEEAQLHGALDLVHLDARAACDLLGVDGGRAPTGGREGARELLLHLQQELMLLGREHLFATLQHRLDGLEGQEALVLELLDEPQPFEVLLRVPGHVAARLMPRGQQSLLDVEVNRLPRQPRGLAQVLHAVPVGVPIELLNGGGHPSTSTVTGVQARETQART